MNSHGYFKMSVKFEPTKTSDPIEVYIGKGQLNNVINNLFQTSSNCIVSFSNVKKDNVEKIIVYHNSVFIILIKTISNTLISMD